MDPGKIHPNASSLPVQDFSSWSVNPASREGAQVCSEPSDAYQEPKPCNGHVKFCDRPYNKMIFAGTHNSFSAIRGNFVEFNANQRSGIATQLEDGIRLLLLDTYRQGPANYLCHHFCILGEQPHREALGQIKDFLDSHPREVLTILYEDHVPPETIEADFRRSGLDEYAYAHPPGEPWPTLGEMIERGTRLVVMAENAGSPPAWYHSLWQFAWDTPFRYFSPDDFSCRQNRGSRANSLFLLNHWVNNFFDFPSEEQAAQVNQFEVLYSRALDCIQESRQIPNFIAVDFYEHGDLFQVVDLLNGVNIDPDIAERAVLSLSRLRQAPDFLLFDGKIADIVHEEPADPSLLSLALPLSKESPRPIQPKNAGLLTVFP